MPTQDFKPRLKLDIAPVAIFRRFGLVFLIIAALTIITASLNLFVKLLLCLLLPVSFYPLWVYIQTLEKVQGLRIEDDAISIHYSGGLYPVDIIASPIVTSWIVIIPLRQISFAKVGFFAAIYAELREWFKRPGDVMPEYLNLVLVQQSCSPELLAKLRALLLTRAAQD